MDGQKRWQLWKRKRLNETFDSLYELEKCWTASSIEHIGVIVGLHAESLHDGTLEVCHLHRRADDLRASLVSARSILSTLDRRFSAIIYRNKITVEREKKRKKYVDIWLVTSNRYIHAMHQTRCNYETNRMKTSDKRRKSTRTSGLRCDTVVRTCRYWKRCKTKRWITTLKNPDKKHCSWLCLRSTFKVNVWSKKMAQQLRSLSLNSKLGSDRQGMETECHAWS